MDKGSLKFKIETAFEGLKSAIARHDDINVKRSDGGWSVGEIAGHLIKGTASNFGATIKTERPYDQHEDAIRDLFLNFNEKFPAAPFLQPEIRQYSAEEISFALRKNKENVLKMIDSEDLTETCTAIELPVWGALTKFEWLILMESHIIRHTHQVNTFNSVS